MAPQHHRTMSDSLVVSAEANPDAEAVVIGGTERYTYGQLHDTALRTARLLQDHGVARGDRVVVFADNSWACVASIFGTWLAGGVVVVVNAQTKADKLAYLLTDSGARVMITEAKLARVFRAVVGTLPILCAGKAPEGTVALDEALAAVEPKPAHHGSVATDLAAFIYTSGSTGEPKGVVMTHQNMTFTVASLIEYLRLGHDERIINLLPLAFDYGLYQLLMAVRLGATLVLEAGFGFPEVIRRRIREERVTVLPGVPTVFATLLAGEPVTYPSVRRVTNTAAALSPELIPRLAAMFPEALIYKMYGLTECKRCTYLPPEDVDRKPTSVGIAIPDTELWLVDADDKRVPTGEVGQLVIRGATVMAGYWEKPEETAKKLKPGPLPGERVLYTGDYCRLDEEGYLYFVARMDDVIKSRGEKVAPKEVESALMNVDGIREAAVIGVPDEILGQAVKAFVVLEEGAQLDPRALIKACQARLESFMVPKEIVIVPSLPRTNTGKIKKTDLK